MSILCGVDSTTFGVNHTTPLEKDSIWAIPASRGIACCSGCVSYPGCWLLPVDQRPRVREDKKTGKVLDGLTACSTDQAYNGLGHIPVHNKQERNLDLSSKISTPVRMQFPPQQREAAESPPNTFSTLVASFACVAISSSRDRTHRGTLPG